MNQVQPDSRNQKLLLICSLVLLVLLSGLSLTLGSEMIGPSELINVLFTQEATDSAESIIVWKLRFPRTVAALLVGASLSIGGLMMQTLFRNPLVGPSILGVNAGASVGAALILLASEKLGLSFLRDNGYSLLVASCLGASGVLVAILFLSRVVGRLTLLVIGILFAQFISSIVGILVHFSSPEQVQAFALWNLGTFTNLDVEKMKLIGPFVFVGIVLAFSQIRSLNAWLLGPNYARSMGISVEKSRTMLIIAAAILAGAVTCFCGPIAFLGIAVPHLSRSLHKTSDHRILLPSALVLGAIVALMADIVARIPGSHHALPINPVLAVIGAPVVISVVLKSQRMRETL